MNFTLWAILVIRSLVSFISAHFGYMSKIILKPTNIHVSDEIQISKLVNCGPVP